MLLDNCYEFGLLLWPSSLKKKFFEEGSPQVTYFASPWIRPLGKYVAKTSLCMSRAMSTSSLPSFINIH